MLKSRKEALIFVIDVKTFYLPFCSFFFYMIVFSKWMSAKAMPHHSYRFGPLFSLSLLAINCITDWAMTGMETSIFIASVTSEFTFSGIFYERSTADKSFCSSCSLINCTSQERITEPFSQQLKMAFRSSSSPYFTSKMLCN